jgi:protein-S-isoprenylcysteine O-methyltransferase Ste14
MVRYLLQMLVWTVFMGVLIFWPAGTFAYPGGWVLMGLFGFGGLAAILWMDRTSPNLLRERMSSPIQKEQAPWDRLWLSFFILLFLAWMAFMSWDASRQGFAAVPPWLQALGVVGILAYGAGVWWSFRENAFAAPVVKVQAEQKVIDTGPYALVRHPMYASTLPLFVGMPLLLGSWRGLLGSIVIVLAVAWRAVHEEAELRKALPDYKGYAGRVPYRLIPHVW